MVQTFNHPPFGPGVVMGIALSGFFDGILLHQILQWHHLLSLVPGETIQRLTAQILADGLFHLLMYGIALAGGVWLLRQWSSLAEVGGRRRLLTGVLAGFGGWNIIDVLVFHWIMGIHHVRLDVAEPVLWDAAWLLGLGLGPMAVAMAVGRRGGGRPGRSAAVVLMIAMGVLGGWSQRPPAASRDTLVVFQPGADPARVMAAVAAADGRLVRVVGDGSIVVLRLPDPARPWTFYRHGAWLVGGAGPAGCLNWSTAAPARNGGSLA